MADSDPDPIVSVDSHPGQPYDTADDGPVAGWVKLPDDFPDGPGPWKQT